MTIFDGEAKDPDNLLIQLRMALDLREKQTLSPLAAFNLNARRRLSEEPSAQGYRQAFSQDVDRILHSRAYTRYIDKTQVFYLIENDHITHRVLHVQLVSKIARTIGRFLGLNEDLIEAISLGHDIGHTPFGHDGESFLSELCRANGIGSFHHNLQSIQFLDKVERKGEGWNLCLQTLDGILCHDGETHDRLLKPNRNKTFNSIEKEIAQKKDDSETPLIPMTLEGCVVRMADVIGYIGRDLEDAIRLNMIRRTDLPGNVTDILGNSNGTIVYRLVTDIIEQSYRKSNISYSTDVSEALLQLKNFNLERIYLNPGIKRHTNQIKKLFEWLFHQYLDDLRTENRSSAIFGNFLEDMSETYIQHHQKEEIVRDFIAGMTDRFFLRQCPEKMRPDI